MRFGSPATILSRLIVSNDSATANLPTRMLRLPPYHLDLTFFFRTRQSLFWTERSLVGEEPSQAADWRGLVGKFDLQPPWVRVLVKYSIRTDWERKMAEGR